MWPLNEILLLQTDPGAGAGGNEGGAGGENPPGGEPTPEPQAGSGDDPGGQANDQVVPATELKKVRDEAAATRKKLREAEKRVEELEGASKSDTEKLSGKVTELTSRTSELEKENRSLRVQLVASDVGIADTARADAANLLDWEKVSDPDDADSVREALQDLVKVKPYLLGNVPGGADGGAGGGRAGQSLGMNELLRGATGRQT